MWPKSFLVEGKAHFTLHNQCHGCWCPGDARSQSTSNHDIGLVLQEYTPMWGREGYILRWFLKPTKVVGWSERKGCVTALIVTRSLELHRLCVINMVRSPIYIHTSFSRGSNLTVIFTVASTDTTVYECVWLRVATANLLSTLVFAPLYSATLYYLLHFWETSFN